MEVMGRMDRRDDEREAGDVVSKAHERRKGSACHVGMRA